MSFDLLSINCRPSRTGETSAASSTYIIMIKLLKPMACILLTMIKS
jgi:hypothetical protein